MCFFGGHGVNLIIGESTLPKFVIRNETPPACLLVYGAARGLVGQAALTLLTRVQRWSVLKAWGMAIAKRRGLRRAIVAVARKLAIVMHRIWVDGTTFTWSRETAASA